MDFNFLFGLFFYTYVLSILIIFVFKGLFNMFKK